MIKRDTPGIAIGGLSGGEDKDSFIKVVDHCTSLLPESKPIYCMGVGCVGVCICSQATHESRMAPHLGCASAKNYRDFRVLWRAIHGYSGLQTD